MALNLVLAMSRMGLGQGRGLVEDLEHQVRQTCSGDGLEQGLDLRRLTLAHDHNLKCALQKLRAVQQGRERKDVALQLAGEGLDDGLGPGPERSSPVRK